MREPGPSESGDSQGKLGNISSLKAKELLAPIGSLGLAPNTRLAVKRSGWLLFKLRVCPISKEFPKDLGNAFRGLVSASSSTHQRIKLL